MDQISVEAPASSANLGPGFDVFAIALDKPRDRIRLRLKKGSRGDRPSVRIKRVTGLQVPASDGENCVGVVILEIAGRHRVKGEIEVELDKRVPVGQGMGSSGASAAAAAVAMNELLGLGLTSDELIYYAGKGEGATSGAPHYDNVSASILGGFVMVRTDGSDRPSAIRFDPPKGLALCVSTPVVKLPSRKTEYARSLLPKSVPLGTLVSNVASASTMVAGFAKKDVKLIGDGMKDMAVEPARKAMIPGYDAVMSAATKAGAEGACISGAGPSMLAVVDRGRSDPRRVLEAMRAAFRKEGVESSGYVTRIGGGARVVKDS